MSNRIAEKCAQPRARSRRIGACPDAGRDNVDRQVRPRESVADHRDRGGSERFDWPVDRAQGARYLSRPLGLPTTQGSHARSLGQGVLAILNEPLDDARTGSVSEDQETGLMETPGIPDAEYPRLYR